MNLSLLRYTKKIFIGNKLHRVFGKLSSPFFTLYNLNLLSHWAQKTGKIAINDFPCKWDYQKRFQLYEQIISTEKLKEEPIDYLEFGVAGGHSFRWFQQNNSNPESRFYGFDTFTGLPEDWGSYKKGTFSQG